MAEPTTPTTARKALILACGNSLRGDDGVAWRIADILDQNPLRPEVDIILTQQLLPEHALPLSATDLAIFLDCSVLTEAGTITTVAIHAADGMPRIFTHHLDPASLLKLAQELYGRAPSHAVAITVGGEAFELSEQLSDSVEAAIPATLHALRNVLLGIEGTP